MLKFQSDTKMPLVSTAIRWVPIRGDSMWPSLRSEDEAGTVRLRVYPKKGQVVVARQKNGLVAHRVLSAAGRFVTLAGDNCSRPDVPIPLENLYGFVVLVRRGGRVLRRAEWDRGRTAVGLLRGHLKQNVRRLRMAVK